MARKLEDTRVQLKGSELKLGADDAPPSPAGVPTQARPLSFAPASIKRAGWCLWPLEIADEVFHRQLDSPTMARPALLIPLP